MLNENVYKVAISPL